MKVADHIFCRVALKLPIIFNKISLTSIESFPVKSTFARSLKILEGISVFIDKKLLTLLLLLLLSLLLLDLLITGLFCKFKELFFFNLPFFLKVLSII